MARVASFLAAAVTLGGLVSLAARADESSDAGLVLRWHAPSACPAEDVVRRDVEKILGGPTSHKARVEGAVEELSPRHWTVHLTTEVDGARGERTVDADSCAALETAAALIVALTVDPGRAIGSPAAPVSGPPPSSSGSALPAPPPPASAAPSAPAPPSPSPPPVPPSLPSPGASSAVPRPPPARAAPPPPAPESPRPLPPPGGRGAFSFGVPSLTVALEADGNVDALPSAAFGGSVAIGSSWGPLRLEVAGSDWLAQKAFLLSTRGQGTTLTLRQVWARACVRVLRVGRLDLFPCGVAGVDILSSEGFGENTPANHAPAEGALGGDALATVHLVSFLYARATAGFRVRLSRPTFEVEEPESSQPLFATPSTYGQGAIGVEAHFP